MSLVKKRKSCVDFITSLICTEYERNKGNKKGEKRCSGIRRFLLPAFKKGGGNRLRAELRRIRGTKSDSRRRFLFLFLTAIMQKSFAGKLFLPKKKTFFLCKKHFYFLLGRVYCRRKMEESWKKKRRQSFSEQKRGVWTNRILERNFRISAGKSREEHRLSCADFYRTRSPFSMEMKNF